MSQPITDELIIETVSGRFPEMLEDLTACGWLWVKAAGSVVKLADAEELAAFVGSLARSYRHFPEIPDCQQRLFFALAAQGCNREMICKALVLARDACGLHGSFTLWRKYGSLPGRWQTWAFTRRFLSDPRCLTNGHFPDQLGLARYISTIGQRFQQMACQHGAA